MLSVTATTGMKGDRSASEAPVRMARISSCKVEATESHAVLIELLQSDICRHLFDMSMSSFTREMRGSDVTVNGFN